MTARRAAVVAEVADVGGCVDVRGAAAEAVLGVGGMLQRRSRLGRVVDAEGDAARVLRGKIPDLRIVGPEDERRVGRERGDRGAPSLGDLLELAVAVELVAKEVPEADRPGPDPAGDVRKRSLVHLEQAELRSSRRQQRRRDSGDEVRSRAVVGEPDPGREDLGRERGGGRLAVGRRHDCRPSREPGRERGDGTRIDGGEQLARQRRTSSAPREPGETAGRAGGGELEGKAHQRPV